MPRSLRPESERERTALLTLLTLFLFASPFTIWMASDDNPWFLPYLFWALVILVGAWATTLTKRDDV